jgi:hypothetical protein
MSAMGVRDHRTDRIAELPSEKKKPDRKRFRDRATSRRVAFASGLPPRLVPSRAECHLPVPVANLREKLNKTRSIRKVAASDTKKIFEKTADVSMKGYLHSLLVLTDEEH